MICWWSVLVDLCYYHSNLHTKDQNQTGHDILILRVKLAENLLFIDISRRKFSLSEVRYIKVYAVCWYMNVRIIFNREFNLKAIAIFLNNSKYDIKYWIIYFIFVIKLGVLYICALTLLCNVLIYIVLTIE